MNLIEKMQYDEERALYNATDCLIRECTFAGPADGESVLKEARNIQVTNCSFSLRYPMWHVKGFTMEGTTMDEKTRAALWYSDDGNIVGCDLGGIKAVRECNRIRVENSRIVSSEFGWKSNEISIKDCSVEAEYLFLDSRNVSLERVNMKGKYSFQYMENLEITDSYLDTKDAFWHSKNVTVKDSIVKGEYLGWYSENLKFVRCKIIGTQPLCYCKGLVLENCTMEETDLSFERSEVDADIKGKIDSVKNPLKGTIRADEIGELVVEPQYVNADDTVIECRRNG